MSKNYFQVIRAGINTTFQDEGRKNLYHVGIPFSGAMDKRNYLLSNKLVGNKINSPALEFAYQGPLLKYFGNKINIAITGDVTFTIKKKDINIDCNCYQSLNLENGDEVDILSTNKSVYGYLAFGGQIDLKYQWSSCSTNTKAIIGANDGKKFENEQVINISKLNNQSGEKKLNYINTKIENIRIIKGTNFDYFSEQSIKDFFSKDFEVTKLTDRMGMRLDGIKLKNIKKTNIKSEGLVKGTIQIPTDGKPIIMLSDHGTLGGYPKLGVVISADYDKLVQIPPGSKIKFKEIHLKDAENLHKLYNMETNNILNKIL